MGASSRSAIHLASASRAQARLSGRDELTPEDVLAVAPYVLRHRLVPRPGADVDAALASALDRI